MKTKKIKLLGRIYTISVSAYTPIKYKNLFNRNFFEDTIVAFESLKGFKIHNVVLCILYSLIEFPMQTFSDFFIEYAGSIDEETYTAIFFMLSHLIKNRESSGL